MRKIGTGSFRHSAMNANVKVDIYYNKKEYKVVVSPTGITTNYFVKNKADISSKLYNHADDKENFYKYLKLDIDEERYDREEKSKSYEKEKKSYSKIENKINPTPSKSNSSPSAAGIVFLSILVAIGLYFLGEYEDSKTNYKYDPGFDYSAAIENINFNRFKTLNEEEVKELAFKISFKSKHYSERFSKVNHGNIEGVCRELTDTPLLKECIYGIITSEEFLFLFEKNREMKMVKKVEGEKLLLLDSDIKENTKLKEIINRLVEINPYFQFFNEKKEVYRFFTLYNKVDKTKDIPFLALKSELYDKDGDKIDIKYLDRNKSKLTKLEKDISELKKLIAFIDKNNGEYNYIDVTSIKEFKEGIEKSIGGSNYTIGQHKVWMNNSTKLIDKKFHRKKIEERKKSIKQYKNTLQLINKYKKG